MQILGEGKNIDWPRVHAMLCENARTAPDARFWNL